MTRRPIVYHIIGAGRRQVSAASELVVRDHRIAVELDPDVVKSRGVFIEIDPKKLRTLDEEGWVFGYPELVDRRCGRPRRQIYRATPPRTPGRRSIDRESRRRAR